MRTWFVAAALVLQSCTSTVSNAGPPPGARATANRNEWVDTPVGRAVRPGGTVKTPAVITRVNPTYPDGTDGLVLLEVVIDEQGKVADAKVLDAPSSALADAAVAAVRQWTFEPTEIDGKRVKVLHAVGIKFKLP